MIVCPWLTAACRHRPEHQAAKGRWHLCNGMVRQVVNKCEQYWPTVKGDIMPQGNIMVKLESEV